MNGPLLPRARTSAQHVLSLQQLHDGGLRGRHDDDAAVLAADRKSVV